MYLPGRHRSPEVVAMAEFLLEQFGHAPWRVPASLDRDRPPDVGPRRR
jgi:hypothetical protein